MGFSIIGSAFLSLFIFIKGHAGLVCGKDMVVDKETGTTLAVPTPDAEKAEEVNKEVEEES